MRSERDGPASSSAEGAAARNAKAEARAAPPLLRFESVTKRFGAFKALDGFSLDIVRGEFCALLGPSGCGKSTLLRLAAGFAVPDAGCVLLDGDNIAGQPPYRRPVNMMFQSYALFPHMTVEGNVAFGLKQERLPRAEIRARVAAMLSLVRLEGLEARSPDQLSGGQRQRVALARALVKSPKVLLLDEPLAALDKKLREETGAELLKLQRRLGTTFVIVTHDQDEAMTLADRVAVMRRGTLAQVGTPAEVYERPRDREVATFIGDVNLVEGRLARRGRSDAVLDTALGSLRVAEGAAAPEGARAWLALRPEKLAVEAAPSGDPESNAVRAIVAGVVFRGPASLLQLRAQGDVGLKAVLPNAGPQARPLPQVGDVVWAIWPPQSGVLLFN